MEMSVEDCIERDRLSPERHPHETSRSVSEMKEWVCAKTMKPDRDTFVRECMKMYTGGESFDVCFANSVNGKTCLCSTELCNAANPSRIWHKHENIHTLCFITLFSVTVLTLTNKLVFCELWWRKQHYIMRTL